MGCWQLPIAPMGHCLAGVHGTGVYKWDWLESDYQMIQTSHVAAVKLLCAGDMDHTIVERLRSVGIRLIVARLYNTITNAPKSAIQYCQEIEPAIARLYDAGIRYFEAHNECNLYATPTFDGEGMGVQWRNGFEFSEWFLRLRDYLAPRYPLMKIGFPAMSPGEAIPNVRYSPERFMVEAHEAVSAADWIAQHVYWGYGKTWGMAMREIAAFANQYRRLILVTEFANADPDIDRSIKGHEYAMMLKTADAVLPPNVGALFGFTLRNKGFPDQQWEGSNIAEIVGDTLSA